MRKNLKKAMSIVLACTLMVGICPIQAKAANYQVSALSGTPISLNGSTSGVITEDVDANTYQVVLAESGTLSIDFTSRMKYYNLRVYDSAGKKVWESKYNQWNEQLGFRNDRYDINLEEGLYYIEVEKYNKATGTYEFTTKFTSANATYQEPNNDLSTASNLDLGKTVNGIIASNDEYDIYKVTLSKSGRVAMKFTSYMKYYNFTVYDSAGKKIWDSKYNRWNEQSKFRTDTYNLDFEKGTYYIEIKSYNDSTGTYQFTTKFTDAKATKPEPNNDFSTAQSVKLGETVVGQIALDDEYDLYKINLTSAKKLMLNVTSYMEYYNIYVYDEDGKEVWDSKYNKWNENVKKTIDKHEVSLNKGLYYIKISGYNDSTGTYNLKVSSAISPKSIKLNKKSLALKAGKTYRLKAKITPWNTDYKEVKWTSSNSSIASVDKNGKVTGRRKGKAVITASTVNNKKYKCTVLIK